MGVEVAHAGVARTLEQLDQVEGLFDLLAAETEVLVEAADALRVEVDVKELAGPDRLGHAVVERQATHRLVRELGVHADEFGCVEALDEGQRVTDRRQQDVAARLVGLGFDRDAHVL